MGGVGMNDVPHAERLASDRTCAQPEVRYPRRCAACGGAVVGSAEAISVEVHGRQVTLEGIEHGCCVTCGEEYLSLEAAAAIQKALGDDNT